MPLLAKLGIAQNNKKMIVKCDNCGKEKRIFPSQLKINKHFYCSRSCSTTHHNKINNPAWRKDVKLKMSLAKKGKPLSKEHRKNLSKSHKGKPTWIKKGDKLSKKHCENVSKAMKGRKFSEETRKRMSIARRKRKMPPMSDETKKKLSESLKGRVVSMETRERMSRARSGAGGANWKGGISKKNSLARHSFRARMWREAVFKRDDWTCQKTKHRGSLKLNAHHIKPFAKYPELRFDINNGITLSEKAHKEFHKKYGRTNNREQILEFINSN